MLCTETIFFPLKFFAMRAYYPRAFIKYPGHFSLRCEGEQDLR